MTISIQRFARWSTALGSGVLAVIVAVSAAQAQSTWDGGGSDNNWNTANNWDPNGVPAFPADLAFGGSTRLTPTNNITTPVPVVRNLTFNNGAGAFVLGGSPIILGDGAADYRSGGIGHNDDSLQTIGNAITLSRGQRDIVTTTAAGGLTLNGAISRNPGSAVQFQPFAGSNIKTILQNTNGILGGWATIRNPAPARPEETFTFARVDGSGNVLPYLSYTADEDIDGALGESTVPASITATSNVRFRGGGDLTLATGTTNMNTFLFEEAPVAPRVVTMGAPTDVLRFSDKGGIFRSNPVGAQNTEYLRFVGGTMTAGNSNAPAELNIWTSTTTGLSEVDPGEQHNFTIHLESTTITNNPNGGAVSVIKNGPGAVRIMSEGNTFSGGLYVNRGVWRIQGNHANGFGAGDVYVASGAQAFVQLDPTIEGEVIPNNFFVAGKGINEGTFEVGAIRSNSDGTQFNGAITLMGDTRLGARGGQALANELGTVATQGVVFNGKVTGNFALEWNVGTGQGAAGIGSNMPTIILTNKSNDWGGNTTIGRGRLRVGGTGEVIPHGAGKGDVTIFGEAPNPTTTSESILSLDSLTETINGLTATGDLTMAIVTNSVAGVGTLRVGANNATSTFGGLLLDETGQVALTKIGTGSLTMTGANLYTGDTKVLGGTLALTSGAATLSNAADLYLGNGGVLNVSVQETVRSLFIDGVARAPGTYNAGNTAGRISGAGSVVVGTQGTNLIPGDFDGNRNVNVDDLTRWKSVARDSGDADADYDGDSDANDFLIWQRNLGRTSFPVASVPEPGAATLAAIALAGLGILRRKRG